MTEPGPVRPKPKSRRWWKVLIAAGLVLVVAVLTVPWWLATPVGQRWLLARANRALAPGSIAWESLRFSWFGPTRFTGLMLRDRQGNQIVFAPRATSDRTLGHLLFDQPRFGTFVLDRATFDVERRPDGRIDLYDTLRPIFRRDPRTNVRIIVNRGQLRFRDALLRDPLTAERADLVMQVGPGPRPITAQLDLRRSVPPRRTHEATLGVNVRIERWWEPEGTVNDMAITVKGDHWPLAAAIAAAGVEAEALVNGRLGFTRRSSLWNFTGGLSLADLDATGPRLAGDHLRLDRVVGTYDISKPSGRAGGWVVRRLGLESPVATIKTEGPLPAPPGNATAIEATLDLAALARQVPHALRLRDDLTLDRGSARVKAESRTEIDNKAHLWDIEAHLSDLLAHQGDRAFTLETPATLSARLHESKKLWTIEQISAHTDFLDATGSGSLRDGVNWTARLDLDGFQRGLRDFIHFGSLELAGDADLSGHYRRPRVGDGYEGRLSGNVRGLRVGGLSSGALHREEIRLDATFAGPAADSGIPRGWARLQASLKTGAIEADLAAAPRGAITAGTLSLSAPLALSDRKARLDGRLAADWDKAGAIIHQLRLAIAPDSERVETAASGEPIALSAHGRFDRRRGELVLSPDPANKDATPGTLALASDGLRISGFGTKDTLRADASLVGELADLGRQVRSWGGGSILPAGVGGRWAARASLREVEDGWQLAAKLQLPDVNLSAVETDPARRRAGSIGPLGLSINASYTPADDRIDLTELVLSGRYATLDARGGLSDLDGERRAELLGTIAPDWDAINSLLAERVEPGARVSGRARPVRFEGSLSQAPGGDWLKAIEGEVGVDLRTADVFGMALGPAPIVLRSRDGKLILDPIDTTLNQGHIHLEPELILDDPEGAWLRLGPNSSIENATINDEVSHRVLAFAAPVLDRATRARGRVSVRLQEALFPLGGGGGPDRTAKVTGAVVFQDAEFVAGPIADQLFDLIRLEQRPSIKLNEPVSLTIADRRVYQRGLSIPIGNLNAITMEGWVDFDRNLSLTASLPLLPTMLQDRPVLDDILGGLRISVPIRGTLAQPEVDRDAFNLAMQDLGKTLLERTATRAGAGLLQLLTRPRPAPLIPPSLRREQRRERRQERRR